MYTIMLIDDEPLILSGIKSLLKWENYDCQIIATARTGNEALTKIRQLQPNIVFCDIKMPTISGIDLLEIISRELPATVFVMLTNLQDFDLVQSAIRFRALDYIVKTQLDSQTLESCLLRAKNEWDNRLKLKNKNHVTAQNQTQFEDFLKDVFLLPCTTQLDKVSLEQFHKEIFNSYCAVQLILKYPTPEMDDKSEIFTWEKELVVAIAEKHFSTFQLISTETSPQSLVLLCGELPSDSFKRQQLFHQFHQTLCSSSQKITNIGISLLITEKLHEITTIYQCRQKLDELLDIYYNTETDFLFTETCHQIELLSLKLTGISTQLEEAVHEKNIARCTSLIEKVMRRIREVPHQRKRAIWVTSELYTTVCDTLKNTLADFQTNSGFFQTEATLNQLNGFYTRTQLLDWLSHFLNTVCALLSQLSEERNHFIDLAKEYVESHLEEHISLSAAAEYVNLSPAYLSSLFRKSCDESFVNYVNKRKINYACHLIKENNYLIYEISYRLGFNNAYYFTKIFKRYTGMTPVDYQNAMKKQK